MASPAPATQQRRNFWLGYRKKSTKTALAEQKNEEDKKEKKNSSSKRLSSSSSRTSPTKKSNASSSSTSTSSKRASQVAKPKERDKPAPAMAHKDVNESNKNKSSSSRIKKKGSMGQAAMSRLFEEPEANDYMKQLAREELQAYRRSQGDEKVLRRALKNKYLLHVAVEGNTTFFLALRNGILKQSLTEKNCPPHLSFHPSLLLWYGARLY